MGKIVYAAGAAHAPGLTGWMDKADPATQAEVIGAYERIGAEIKAAEIDVLVMVANDHLANYEPSDYPDFVLGDADEHVGPAEWFRPWLGLDEYKMPGDPGLATMLYDSLKAGTDLRILTNGALNFDDNVSVPSKMTGFLDHGTPLVPVIQNCTVPPVPGSRASYEVGRVLGQALRENTPDDLRIGLLGSGGLSHEPGGPRYLEIDEAFDRRFLELLAAGDHEALLSEITWERMEEAGAGGTAELLSWMVVMGAIGERDCEVLCYACVPEWRCGVGAAVWAV
jgi:aromatic ring-opening dioxygenase catalytic subunit (LigB family)